MDIFKGQNLIEFTQRFQTEQDCRKYLSEIKWSKGFTCVKCQHQAAQIRKDFSRTCNRCSHTESPGANTLFHKIKFGLLKAFHICFEMSTTTKGLSALQVAKRYSIRPSTARLFMHKVREAMKSSQTQPMDGQVHVDEFVVGGQESGKVGRSYGGKKKKVVCAVELTDSGKVKRFYSMQITDYSAKSLRPLFERHIAKTAQVTADEWKGYKPLAKEYSITQIPSELGLNFSAIHNLIHQVKSWIRTTYSWVSKQHIERYLNEYSYRINRSQTKDTIFHNLINRMVKSNKLSISEIVCA